MDSRNRQIIESIREQLPQLCARYCIAGIDFGIEPRGFDHHNRLTYRVIAIQNDIVVGHYQLLVTEWIDRSLKEITTEAVEQLSRHIEDMIKKPAVMRARQERQEQQQQLLAG